MQLKIELTKKPNNIIQALCFLFFQAETFNQLDIAQRFRRGARETAHAHNDFFLRGFDLSTDIKSDTADNR
jgi:hypothetical protein